MFTKIRDHLIMQETLISLYFDIYIFEMWKIYSLISLFSLLKLFQEFLPTKKYGFICVTIENIR